MEGSTDDDVRLLDPLHNGDVSKSAERRSDVNLKTSGRKWVVEPMVALYIISGIPLASVRSQYLYKKVQETMGVTLNFTADSCGVNKSDPAYILQQAVQAESANWSMYLSLANFIPTLIMTVFIGVFSDHFGRRIAFLLPPIGSIVSTLADMAVMTFDLPIGFLFLETTEYFFGGMMTLTMGAFAYLADTVEPEKRAVRMTIIDCTFLLGAAVGELAVGYIIRAQGYLPPLYYVCIGKILTLLYALFFIPEPNQSKVNLDRIKTPEELKAQEAGEKTNAAIIFFRNLKEGFLLYIRDDGKGRRWKLCILLASYLVADLLSTYKVLTLFEMDSPLCWGSVLIGYFGSVAMILKCFMTLLVGFILRKVNVLESWIAVLSRFLTTAEYAYLSFVSNTVMMFFAPVLGSISFLAIPMTRAIMSKMVDAKQQGALFAVMTSASTISSLISTFSVSKIYAATVMFWTGFVFLFAAGLLAVSVTLLLFYISFTTGLRGGFRKPARSYTLSVRA